MSKRQAAVKALFAEMGWDYAKDGYKVEQHAGITIVQIEQILDRLQVVK